MVPAGDARIGSMTFEQFMASLAAPAPSAELSPALAALWWMVKGDWERVHHLVNDLDGGDEAWVHAHLHRVEGDLANANYWYRQAGKTPSSAALEAEREAIVKALLRETRSRA
jgi:hypothetical protein